MVTLDTVRDAAPAPAPERIASPRPRGWTCPSCDGRCYRWVLVGLSARREPCPACGGSGLDTPPIRLAGGRP